MLHASSRFALGSVVRCASKPPLQTAARDLSSVPYSRGRHIKSPAIDAERVERGIGRANMKFIESAELQDAITPFVAHPSRRGIVNPLNLQVRFQCLPLQFASR